MTASINIPPSKETSILGHRRYGQGSEKVLVLDHWMVDAASYEPLIPLSRSEHLHLRVRGHPRLWSVSVSHRLLHSGRGGGRCLSLSRQPWVDAIPRHRPFDDRHGGAAHGRR